MAKFLALALAGTLFASTVQAASNQAPSDLSATAGEDGIQLSWTGGKHDDWFTVYRDGAAISNTTAPNYFDVGASNASQYWVTAWTKHGESPPSNSASVAEGEPSAAAARAPREAPKDCVGASLDWPPVFVNPESCLDDAVDVP